VVVDQETEPFAFVVIDGIAEVSFDHDDLLHWATALGARYMGADRAEEFGRRNAAPSELLVRVRPSRIVAIGGMTD
jgi:hypothetical protein